MRKGKDILPVYDLWPFYKDEALNKEVYAARFAPYLETHPHFLAPHRHSFYHMLLFTSGSGIQTIDFEQFDICKGQIYFMAPGQVHNWRFSAPPDGFVVNFSPSFFNSFLSDAHYLEQFQFFNGVARDSILQLQDDLLTAASQILMSVIRETERNEPGAADMVRLLLLSLFITVNREISASAGKPVLQHNKLILLNFRKLVDTYYTEKKLPKEYAALLYITPNHLNALCRDVLGKPAGEIIRKRVLLQAKRLLVNADLQISEIARQLNFPDNSYFTKFFKKYSGYTPDEFRKRSIENTLK